MIDRAKIGERSVPHGSFPALLLSPLFYFPPPLGSLCGGERVCTLVLACIAGVPDQGDQKAAAGEGEGLKNGEGGGKGR